MSPAGSDRPVVHPRLPPGAGRHPLGAAVSGALQLGVLGLFLLLASRVASGDIDLAGPDAGPATATRWSRVGLVAALLLVPFVVHAAAVTMLAVADLGTPRRTVRGTVVEVSTRRSGDGLPGWLQRLLFRGRGPDRSRPERHYVAVDDGGAGPLRALRVSPRRQLEVDVGEEVEADVSRWLGHVGRFRARRRPDPVRTDWVEGGGRAADLAADLGGRLGRAIAARRRR